jgi:hypothetical protein
LAPEGQISLVSFDLAGVEEESVVNHERLEDHQRKIESNDGQDGEDKHQVCGPELEKPVVPSWGWDSGIQILVDLHVQSLVVSYILVVIQNELVKHFVISVDDFKRQLSVGVVDSVIDNGVTTAQAHEP